MRQLLILAGSLSLLAIGIAIVRQYQSAEQPTAILRPDAAAYVSEGKVVYAENCALCHGVKLEGQVADWKSPDASGRLPAPPHDETGHTWHHPDQTLFDITKFGVAKAANLKNYDSAMPAYEGILSDKEIVAVLSYIKSTWPDDIRQRHDMLNQR